MILPARGERARGFFSGGVEGGGDRALQALAGPPSVAKARHLPASEEDRDAHERLR